MVAMVSSNHWMYSTLNYIIYIPIIYRRKVFRKKSLKNHGAWWLILLLYSPVTYTSFSILNCPAITVNGTSENVSTYSVMRAFILTDILIASHHSSITVSVGPSASLARSTQQCYNNFLVCSSFNLIFDISK